MGINTYHFFGIRIAFGGTILLSQTSFLYHFIGFLISYYIIVGCIHPFHLILILRSAWVSLAHSLFYEHPLRGAYFLFPNVNANM